MIYNFICTHEGNEAVYSAYIRADKNIVDELYRKYKYEVSAIYTDIGFDGFIEFLHQKGITANRIKTEQIYM